MNVLIPRGFDKIASRLPYSSGLTPKRLIEDTTLFPYFAPFLTEKRKTAFFAYMGGSSDNTNENFFLLGLGRLRQPKNLLLRFCKSCVNDDYASLGETYWHRLHQLPGVLICHKHREPLYESKISFAEAGRDFYPALPNVGAGSCCNIPDSMDGKYMSISINSEWLLQNGCHCGSLETAQLKYDLWFRAASLRGFGGSTRHKEVYAALREFYGDEFLKVVDAYDEIAEESWAARITHYPNSLLHPMYHVLMAQILAGSIAEFFEKECAKTLPFEKGPWPCHNPVCPEYLRDIIEEYTSNPYHGYIHARFECPVCGMVYRRKQAMPKHEQYIRKPKFVDYGPLWYDTLRRCLVEEKMTARETCRLMKCDFYTVNKHALMKGFIAPDEAYSYSRPVKEKREALSSPLSVPGDELKQQYRSRWLQLIESNPNINRSRMIFIDHECHSWLRKNDLKWYEDNSPPERYTYFDWESRDAEVLDKVRLAVESLRTAEGKPKWVSRDAVITLTGLHILSNKRAMAQMPLTSAFLEENLESMVEWRKRKITWAIRTLHSRGAVITLHKIKITAGMSSKAFNELVEYARDCLALY